MEICIEAGEIPICNVCGHHHIQGIKCQICGHVGRSQIYPKMRAKAIEKRALRVGVYDGINMEDLTESWTIIQELRRMIFINEGISQVESEFNDQLDKNSRHFLLFLGDAPVCVGRYRTLGQADQSFVTMIDRVGVLPQYRNNGLASYCMNAMMAEISNRPMNNTAVLIMVPENSFLKSKLLGNRGSMYSGVVHEHWNVSPGSVLICLSAAS